MNNINIKRIKYYIIENEQISLIRVFVTDEKEIYEAKIEIQNLEQDFVTYNIKYVKTNSFNIDFSLKELGSEPVDKLIEKVFLPFRLNEELKSLLDANFFSANLPIKQLKYKLKKIEETIVQYPPLSVAYFRIIDSLLALLYARNTLEMNTNITSFFILSQEFKYNSPHNSVLEYCILRLNRK